MAGPKSSVEQTRDAYERGRDAARLGRSSLDVLGSDGKAWHARGEYGGVAISWPQMVAVCGWLDEKFGAPDSEGLKKVEAGEAYFRALSEGKIRPVAIHNERQQQLFYDPSTTDEERSAWNRYAQEQADSFNRNPSLDTYDSTDTTMVMDPDTQRVTSWAPERRFQDWLAERREAR